MSQFYLEKPTVERKQDAIEYIKEYFETNSKIAGTGGLNRLMNGMSYEKWLKDVIKCENTKYAKRKGFVPSSTYFTVREEDNRIVGMINVRHYLTEELYKYVGHIGYGIRPAERQKGYAKIQLYLILTLADEINLERVMICCDELNTASDKTILALGGVLDRIEYEESRDRTLKVYWIDVKEALNKYSEQYSRYVSDKNLADRK